MPSGRIVLLHDNARPHTANLARCRIQLFDWETLPPYSPDLSPWDFHIYDELKKYIRWRWFHSDEEVQEWMRLWIHQRPTSFSKNEIDCVVSQRDKCINTSGSYLWIKKFHCHFVAGVLFSFDCSSYIRAVQMASRSTRLVQKTKKVLRKYQIQGLR